MIRMDTPQGQQGQADFKAGKPVDTAIQAAYRPSYGIGYGIEMFMAGKTPTEVAEAMDQLGFYAKSKVAGLIAWYIGKYDVEHQTNHILEVPQDLWTKYQEGERAAIDGLRHQGRL